MTINKAYLTFLQLVERNFTNDNVDVDKSRFILLYNIVAPRFVEWTLEKRNEDDIRDVQELLVLDKLLTNSSTNLNHKDFNIPDNYLDFSSVQILAKQGSCNDIKLFSHEVRNDDVEEYLADVFNEPSFKYRETFYTISSNNIAVYFKDFDISKIYLSYYRYPTEVDIEGYINIEGKTSKNIDPELSDRIVNKILLAMAKEHSAINADLNKYQVDKDRIFSNI